MTNVLQISRAARGKEREKTCVVALHCSLGSGRQWKALADELGRSHRFFAPDISGYGTNSCALDYRLTLAEEVRALSGTLNDADGPIHLVGHSYGGALPSRSQLVRLRASPSQPDVIEPVLPTLLCESDADRRLHARFAQVGNEVSEDIWNGSVLEAIDKFTAFWNGSGPQDPLPATARLRMIERADKLAFDFKARSLRRMSRLRQPASRSDAAVFGRAVALSHPTHRAAARRDHGRRRGPASAGRRPYAPAHPCLINQSRDRAAYRPRGRTGRRSAGGRASAGGGRQHGGGVTFLALGSAIGLLVTVKTEKGNETQMTILRARGPSLTLAPLIAAGMICLCAFPALAADDPKPPPRAPPSPC